MTFFMNIPFFISNGFTCRAVFSPTGRNADAAWNTRGQGCKVVTTVCVCRAEAVCLYLTLRVSILAACGEGNPAADRRTDHYLHRLPQPDKFVLDVCSGWSQ